MKAAPAAAAMTSWSGFLSNVNIDTDDGAKVAAKCLDDWQIDDFAAIENGMLRVVGLPVKPTKPVLTRAYLERARGHSKTTDIALVVLFLLLASRKQINGLACAADRDQSRLLIQAIERIVRVTPWMAQLIDVQAHRVVNLVTGSSVETLSSDVSSSWGHVPSFAICDELTHWNSRELWDSLFSSAAKRRDCLLLVIANAGMGIGSSWHWQVREACRESDGWYFSRLDGPVASWISKKLLAEQERMLPTSVFRRLWLNIWSSTAGDALEEGDLQAALTLAGPMKAAEVTREHKFVMGLDLGVRQDSSAAVILATKQGSPRIRLAWAESWSPAGGNPVDLIHVQRRILELHRVFRLEKVIADPFQAELMMAQLKRAGLLVEPMTFVGQNLNLMATSVLQTFRARRIDLYPDTPAGPGRAAVLDDLRAMSIVQKSYGYRLESTRVGTSHQDAGTALAICLGEAETMAHRGSYGALEAPAYATPELVDHRPRGVLLTPAPRTRWKSVLLGGGNDGWKPANW